MKKEHKSSKIVFAVNIICWAVCFASCALINYVSEMTSNDVGITPIMLYLWAHIYGVIPLANLSFLIYVSKKDRRLNVLPLLTFIIDIAMTAVLWNIVTDWF